MQTRSRLRAMFVLVVVSTLVFLVRAPTTKSQNKPDLSGTWLLDVKKSEGSGLTSRPDVPIRISHHDPEFRQEQQKLLEVWEPAFNITSLQRSDA